jgi:Flp pilus assembly protein TadG
MNTSMQLAGLRGRVRSRNREAGQEIVEFAFTLPLLMMMIFAIMWGARAYNTYETMTRAAREAARYAAAPTCALCGNAYPTPSQVADVVSNYMQVSALKPAYMQTYAPTYAACNGAAPACTTTNNVTICSGVPVSNSGTQQCGTAVSFAYPVSLSMSMSADTSSSMVLPTLTLKTQSQMVPEQ